MPLRQKFNTIYDAFIQQYGILEGEKVFKAYLNQRGINESVRKKHINPDPFTFTTDSIRATEVETKAGKEYYVTGYISTPNLDQDNDIVSKECLEDMVEQLKTRTVKLDVEHEAYKRDTTIIPIGKIIEAKLDKKGIWVKATINKDSSRFKEIWNSLKNGFLDSFSITFRTKDYVTKMVDGVEARVLKLVDLLNVAITGNPAQREAKIMQVIAKSLDSQSEQKMADEEKPVDETPQETPEAEPPAAPEGEAEQKAEKVEVVEKKSISEVLTELKTLQEEVSSLRKQREETDEVQTTIKAIKTDITELKAKMAEPVQKAIITEPVQEENVEVKQPIDLIK